MRYTTLILFLFSFAFLAAGQQNVSFLQVTDSVFHIQEIKITGNKKTKVRILLRELPVKLGDSIHVYKMDSVLERCKQQLVNLGLFNVVKVSHIPQSTGHTTIQISVIERWYTWPLPIFQIADRNFNQWWISRDLERINYGIELSQFNVRGRNETLKIKLQNGFTRKVEATYSFPWIDRKQRIGLALKVTYLGNREIWYATFNNKLQFYRDDSRDMFNRFTAGFTLKFRPKLFNSNYVSLFYNDIEISDEVLAFNPDYLLDSRTSQKAFTLTYTFVRDRRDYKYFPLKGHYTSLELSHTGLGVSKDINLGQLNLVHNRYLQLGGPYYIAFGLKSRVTLPEKQSYFNYRALGYTDFVRGYEYYVIDGQHSFLFKSTINKRIFRRQLSFKFLPLKQLHAIPFDIYLAAFSDYGYAVNHRYNLTNSFANSLLIGYGTGLNFVAFYDRILRAEVAMNRENRAGLYLHLYYPF